MEGVGAMFAGAWQYTPLTVPLLLTGLLCAWVAYVAWRRQSVPESFPFAVLMAAIAGWTLLSVVEKSLVALGPRRAVSTWVYVFIVTTPGAWLAFTVRFARLDRGWVRKALPLLFVEPLLVLGLAFTDTHHGWFRVETAMQTDCPVAIMAVRYGPLFWAHAVYTYTVFAVGAVCLVRGMSRRPEGTVGRLVVILAGMALPTLGNVAYVMRWQPDCWEDLTPLYFALTGLAAAWMLFHVRLFDILPVAREAVLDCLSDPVLVLDHRGRILDTNSAARTLSALPPFALRRRPLEDAFPDLAQHISEQPPRREIRVEIRLLLAGEERYWDMHVLPMIDWGVTVGVLIRLADVTERRQAEEERTKLLAQEQAARIEAQRLWKEAAAADRRKDEFLALLGHELRNPLTPLRNAVYLLRQDGASPPARHVLEILDRQVGHLSRLVDDLLDVARITHGKIQLQPERLDLTRLVRATIEDRRASLETAGLGLTLELTEGPVWVWGDSARLAQAVDNLIVNASKFTDAGGQVFVRLAILSAEARSEVTVQDTGIGIEPDLLPRLFEPFIQGNRGLARSRSGLGLGLALVQELIRLHGGEVLAESAGPGQGAQFRIRLPLESETVIEPTPPPAPSNASSPRCRVLVIDDNHDTADTWRLLLEGKGHQVAVVYTGQTGVEMARHFRPDVVLSDVGLPDIDGYAVAQALRKDPATAETLLIAITGYGQAEDQRRARAAGFDCHLIKPVDFGEFLHVLATLLAERRTRGIK